MGMRIDVEGRRPQNINVNLIDGNTCEGFHAKKQLFSLEAFCCRLVGGIIEIRETTQSDDNPVIAPLPDE